MNTIKAAGSEFVTNLDTGAVYLTGAKGKGGKAHTATEAENTLRSAAVVKVVEVVSEGPIAGICGGARGILINETPLMNADGTFNFPRVGWDYRVGLPSQDYMPGFASATAEISVNAPLILSTPVIRTTTSVNIDVVKVAMLLPQGLSKQNTKNGDLNGSSVTFRVETKRTADSAWTSAQTFTITGKTTSPYEAQYRIERPAGIGLWDIRVTRLTAEPGAAEKTQTTVSRITEVIDVKLGYDDTAVIGLAIDAESVGSSIPTRSYMVKGKIVSVPANYNEEGLVGGALGTTGTAYTGVWNGVFKEAWTQNPAWILYDLLTNPRYGMGEFVSANDIDVYSFYDAAVYNDTLVPDGLGQLYINSKGEQVTNGVSGLESRFTFGGILTTQEDAGKILQMVAGSFRATLLQINGKWTVLQDRPSSPVRNITNSNVEDGQFVYRSTGLFDRHTAFNITWNNRADRYLRKVSTVEDIDGIARYGYFPLDLAAYGATTEGQALRMGRWALDTEQNQTETVTFKMSLNGFDLLPNDIFNLYDEDYTNMSDAGRIVSVVGLTVTLDKPVTLEPGSTISCTLVDGSIESRGIVQLSGTVDSFTLASGFSQAVLDHADYVVITSVAARQFKIINLRFPSEAVVEIDALYHDPNKYSRVETGVSLPTPIFSNANAITNTVVVCPTELTFIETAVVNPDGTVVRTIATSWVAATLGSMAVGYQVRYSRNGETSTLLDTPHTMVAIPAISDGLYDISIIAYDGAGRLCGTALKGTHEINSEDSGDLAAVTNLYVKGTLLNTWNTDDLSFTWTDNPANTMPTQDYLVEIRSIGNILHHSEYVTKPTFTYTLAAAKGDALLNHTTLAPQINVTVTPRDLFNRLGAALSATFTNARPAAPTFALVAGAKSISVTVSPCTESDYLGTYIYSSTVSGFTPGPENLIYDGTGNFLLMTEVSPDGPVYFRAAHYDSYSKTNLNISDEYATTPLASLGNKVAMVSLYRWSATQPANPSGTSSFQWTNGAHTNYTGPVGWSVTAPPNPNTASLSLWQATKQVVDMTIAQVTQLDWTNNFTVTSVSANGSAGADAITISFSNEAHTIPTDSAGANGNYTGSGTTINVFEGTSELVYDGVGNTNSTWKVTVDAFSITAGSLADTGDYLTVGQHSAMTADVARINYTISGRRASGLAFSVVREQSFSKSKSGSQGAIGASAMAYWSVVGAAVFKKTTANVYIPASSSVSLYGASGTNAPALVAGRFVIDTTLDGSAYTNLYTSAADETTRAFTPPANIVAVRVRSYLAGGLSTLVDESVIPVVFDGVGDAGATGPAGDTYRVGYAVSTVSSLSSTPSLLTNAAVTASSVATNGNASFPANNTWGGSETWSASPTALNAGEYLFKIDGIYSVSSNKTVWGNAYQAALKVGELSAISANLGDVTGGTFVVDAGGFIRGGQTGYNIGTGFWMGYDGSGNAGYKFSLGNTLQGITWSNGIFTIKGELVAVTGTLGSLTMAAGGSIKSGGYTQWGWPQVGYSGFYLGTEGLLLGNAYNNNYVMLYEDGRFDLRNNGKGIASDGTIVTIHGDLIATGNIKNNAVTNIVSSYVERAIWVAGQSGTVNPPNEDINAMTATLECVGGLPVIVTVNFRNLAAQVLYGQSIITTAKVKRDGVVIRQFGLNNSSEYTTMMILDTPTNGLHTYSMDLRSSQQGVNASHRFISAMECRR